MPKNLTDVDTFTDPLQSIVDGDSVNETNETLLAQGVANRTRNNRNRLDVVEPWALVTITGTTVALGSRLSLALTDSYGAGWAVGSNEVTLPSTGTYSVELSLTATSSSAANPSFSKVKCQTSPTGAYSVRGSDYRWSVITADTFHMNGSGILVVTGSQVVEVINDNAVGNMTVSSSDQNSIILIKRLTS